MIGFVRVILDANVWSYIGEWDEAAALGQAEQNLGLKLVIPPSILLEVLRTPRQDVRDRIVAAITSRGSARVHPLPEARSEAAELIVELRRTRTQWIRSFPATSRVSVLENFWTKKIWLVARADPDSIARRAATLDTDAADAVLSTQRLNQEAARATDFRLRESEPWADLTGATESMRAGWGGERLEAWRIENALIWWRGLVQAPGRAAFTGEDTTHADWVGPWIRLDLLSQNRANWNRLWYYDIEAENVPRNRIRQYVAWAQLESRIGSGNPRDAQHAAYLFDSDLFVTADRRYASALKLVRMWTSARFAVVILVPARRPIVQTIVEALGREPR